MTCNSCACPATHVCFPFQETSSSTKEDLRISEQARGGSGIRQEGVVSSRLQPLQAYIQQRDERRARRRTTSATSHAQRYETFNTNTLLIHTQAILVTCTHMSETRDLYTKESNT